MTLSAMTFNENYGTLPRKTLALVRKYNVSPADFDQILDSLMFTSEPGVDQSEGAVAASWWDVDQFIIRSSESRGYYSPSRYL